MTVNFQIKKVRNPIATKSTKWQQTATKWLATINGQKFNYWTGSGLTETPTYDNVLDCLLSDSFAADLTFAEFCAEFDYEANQESKRVYAVCQENADKLQVTGIDLEVERKRLDEKTT